MIADFCLDFVFFVLFTLFVCSFILICYCLLDPKCTLHTSYYNTLDDNEIQLVTETWLHIDEYRDRKINIIKTEVGGKNIATKLQYCSNATEYNNFLSHFRLTIYGI